MGELKVLESLEEGFRTVEDFPLIIIPSILSAFAVLIPDIPSMFGENAGIWIVLVSLVLSISMLLLRVFLQGWMVKLSYEEKKGEPDLKQDAVQVWDRFLPLAVASVIYGIAVFLGILVLVIPGIFLLIKLIFYKQTVILDDKSAIDSLKESWKLLKGNWWKVFAVALSLFLPYILLTLIPYLGAPSWILMPVKFVLDVFMLPWRVSTFTTVYLKLK